MLWNKVSLEPRAALTTLSCSCLWTFSCRLNAFQKVDFMWVCFDFVFFWGLYLNKIDLYHKMEAKFIEDFYDKYFPKLLNKRFQSYIKVTTSHLRGALARHATSISASILRILHRRVTHVNFCLLFKIQGI